MADSVVHQRWQAREAAQATLPMPTQPSALESAFAAQLEHAGLPAPEREFIFAPPRRFRFDFAWPVPRIAVELDGGTWIGGRHTRGSGFERDLEKLNLAALLSWTVLRFTGAHLRSGDALRLTALALNRWAAP